jgi:hypothetical protein
MASQGVKTGGDIGGHVKDIRDVSHERDGAEDVSSQGRKASQDSAEFDGATVKAVQDVSHERDGAEDVSFQGRKASQDSAEFDGATVKAVQDVSHEREGAEDVSSHRQFRRKTKTLC